jgi:hypothetical protein
MLGVPCQHEPSGYALTGNVADGDAEFGASPPAGNGRRKQGAFPAFRARRNIDAGLHRAYASHPGFLEGEPQQSGRSGQFRGE